MRRSYRFSNIKSLISLLLLLVAAVLFLMYFYKDFLIKTNAFNLFMTLTVIAVGLLAVLSFLDGEKISFVRRARKRRRSS